MDPLRTLLVVDDDVAMRQMLASLFRDRGFQVREAASAGEALDLAREADFGVVLTDVRMPKMTGYELCKVIKAEPTLEHVPVVFLSAKGQEAEVKTGLQVGATEYLLKPFAPDQLTRKVADILARPKK